METTEKIVESYVRYRKGWFTIPNIRCGGQFEVDLLAIDASDIKDVKRYYIESGVSISSAFSKLTANEFSKDAMKDRVKQAEQRRTLGYFIHRKFDVPQIVERIKQYGFEKGNYTRVIVTWEAKEEAEEAAKLEGVEIWKFPDILKEIVDICKGKEAYYVDDTLRTLQLYFKSIKTKR